MLDLYTIAVLVISGRGFYLAHRSSCEERLVARLRTVAPGILGVGLLGGLFCGYVPTSTLEVLIVWVIAIAYCFTPGCRGDISGTA